MEERIAKFYRDKIPRKPGRYYRFESPDADADGLFKAEQFQDERQVRRLAIDHEADAYLVEIKPDGSEEVLKQIHATMF